MKTRFIFFLIAATLFWGTTATGRILPGDTLLVHYTVIQCDSLIQANATNPDFAVMDVRTPAEYLPEHLEGAINRDYYASNFSSLLDLLPQHKLYLIYCASGGRSSSVFNMMVSKGFTKVANMLGGISTWKNTSLPTTPDFAPLHMAVSDTMIANDTVVIGTVDTLLFTVTNRANDSLRFTGITSLAGTEFSTDFNLETSLEGPFDYTFSIFYSPADELADSIGFLIESNGGSVLFHIARTGRMPAVGVEEIANKHLQLACNNYPNPFRSATTISFELETQGQVNILILNPIRQVIDKITMLGHAGRNEATWQAGYAPGGIYFYTVSAGKSSWTGKMVVLR